MNTPSRALLCALLFAGGAAQAQTTAFTYQGRFNTNAAPYTGTAEFQFTLWDAASGGSAVATNSPTSVVGSVDNGLFTATLDFGLAPFNGQPRFLQIEARTAIGPFATLTPRQPLTATPYALRALNVQPGGLPGGTYANAVTFNNAANQFTGTFTGGGSALTGLNASELTTGTVPLSVLSNAWKISGNTGANPTNGAFLGTTDNLPLELKVNGQRALRLVPDTNGTAIIIGGSANNFVHTSADSSIIAAGDLNSISEGADIAVIGGGLFNRIRTNSSASVIGGGSGNLIDNSSGAGVIAGGNNNRVETNVLLSTIGGGFRNVIQSGSGYSVIGGGNSNTNGGSFATVPGGQLNSAQGDWSFAAGRRAKANHAGTFVWADAAQAADFASSGDHQFLIRAFGGVGINTNASLGTALNVAGTVQANTLRADSFVGSGGSLTDVNAITLGGLNNSNFWRTSGNAGTTAGTHFIGTTDNRPMDIRANNVRAARFEVVPDNAFDSNIVNVVLGAPVNFAGPGVKGATISGGGATRYSSASYTNKVTGDFGTVGGGSSNSATNDMATVGGGDVNTAGGFASVVSGGQFNFTRRSYATVGGGQNNNSEGFAATISGGQNNRCDGLYATVPGGYGNTTAGDYSFAAGRFASANHAGAFVWADSQSLLFSSTTSNQFRVRAGGGMDVIGGGSVEAFKYSSARTGGFATPVGLALNSNTAGQSSPALRVLNQGGDSIDGALSVSIGGTGFIAKFGNSSAFVSSLTANGTWSGLAFNPTSDRAAKENFAPVDSREVLDKVAALPLARWNYKAAPGLDHIGPVAQDFHAAFGLNGSDDKHISTVDADGVALAAIQGLNQKLAERESLLRRELERRDAENAELKQRLEKLERITLNQKANQESAP